MNDEDELFAFNPAAKRHVLTGGEVKDGWIFFWRKYEPKQPAAEA